MELNMKKIAVISDFDGTITTRDSLVEVLDSFAGNSWHKVKKLRLKAILSVLKMS